MAIIEWVRNSLSSIFNSGKVQYTNFLKKEYEQDLNSLPVLIYLKSSRPSMQELLTALIEVNKNARNRMQDSAKAVMSFREEQNLVDKSRVEQFARVMDHGVSRLYLPILLKSKLGWSEEKISTVILSLVNLRSEQRKTQKRVQVGLIVGATLICLAPHPGAKLISTAAKLLIRNFCLLGSSGGLNTYYLLESHSNYVQKIENFLSSPDGWNQMTRLNQVMEEKKEFNSWLIFYAFEFLPGYELAKFFWRL